MGDRHPPTYALAHWTSLPILLLYPISEGASVLKLFLGLYMVRKGVWIRNIVRKRADEEPAQV